VNEFFGDQMVIFFYQLIEEGGSLLMILFQVLLSLAQVAHRVLYLHKLGRVLLLAALTPITLRLCVKVADSFFRMVLANCQG